MSSRSYQSLPVNDLQLQETVTSRRRASHSFLAIVMLGICIVSFVLQTELAQYVQRTTSYSKPYFILYISHCCYIFMIPIQLIAEYIVRGKQPNKSLWSAVKYNTREIAADLTQSMEDLKSRKEQGTEQHVTLQRWAFQLLAQLSIMLTVPSYLWYLSVNLTSMSNLTAIYNTGCFFAYLFSIVMLNDRIVASKVVAVTLCIIGVFTMAFWSSSDEDEDDATDKSIISSAFGILVASIGAACYGFYEVYYKKYASPRRPSVLFANVLTGCIGIMTLVIMWIPLPILDYFGYETFELPDATTFQCILGIASMSVVYNATFMCVIALANPVFAAVGVMLTVPAVAVTDVLVTGIMVPASTIIGSACILVGFYILNRKVGQETVMVPDDIEDQ
ncbi:hypothetical protein VTP01DRAFT_5776 [Rhizomucor pusillus]|uniref:uncharacterized protein n=1 Tax=Rhizomucor pusillus TaxID=4840 RepID=UPI003742178C